MASSGLAEQPCRFGRAGICAAVAACLLLANCSTSERLSNIDPRYGTSSSPRMVGPGEPVPKGGGTYRVGSAYTIGGKTYVPSEDPHYRAEGTASWYGSDFHGRLTANGEVFDMNSMSAAHTTMPLPSYARVTNLSNGRSVIVRVNDRGPYHAERVMDVSSRAATVLGFVGNGLAPVRVEYVGPAPLEGSDDSTLMATYREGSPAPAPAGVRTASRGGAVVRGGGSLPRDVPVPPGRPYSLGEAQMISNYRPAGGSGTSVARGPDANRSVPLAANRNAAPGAPVNAYASPADARLDSPTAMALHGIY